MPGHEEIHDDEVDVDVLVEQGPQFRYARALAHLGRTATVDQQQTQPGAEQGMVIGDNELSRHSLFMAI